MTTTTTAKPTRRRKLRRWLLAIAAITLPLWLAFLTYINWAMHQSPEVFGRVMMHVPMPVYFVLPFETLWNRARAGHLRPGDPAPSFTLNRLAQDNPAHTPVTLATLWQDRPVVLVFGSYT